MSELIHFLESNAMYVFGANFAAVGTSFLANKKAGALVLALSLAFWTLAFAQIPLGH